MIFIFQTVRPIQKATEKDQLEEISRLFPGEEQNYRRFMTELKSDLN